MIAAGGVDGHINAFVTDQSRQGGRKIWRQWVVDMTDAHLTGGSQAGRVGVQRNDRDTHCRSQRTAHQPDHTLTNHTERLT